MAKAQASIRLPARPFVIKRPENLSEKQPENSTAISEACEIIAALLETDDLGHDSRGGLRAYTAMREVSQQFCKACERKGQVLHAQNFCTCACHAARRFLEKHRGEKSENSN